MAASAICSGRHFHSRITWTGILIIWPWLSFREGPGSCARPLARLDLAEFAFHNVLTGLAAGRRLAGAAAVAAGLLPRFLLGRCLLRIHLLADGIAGLLQLLDQLPDAGRVVAVLGLLQILDRSARCAPRSLAGTWSPSSRSVFSVW